MRVKSKCKNKNMQKKEVLSLHSLHSLHGVHGLQSAWSAFWGDQTESRNMAVILQLS